MSACSASNSKFLTTLALGFTSQSKFKTVGFDEAANYHPVHLIDQYCLSTDSIKWLTIRFRIEYTGADGDSNTVQVDPSMNAYINQDLFFNENIMIYAIESFFKVYKNPRTKLLLFRFSWISSTMFKIA